jgi:hypothetical protein
MRPLLAFGPCLLQVESLMVSATNLDDTGIFILEDNSRRDYTLVQAVRGPANGVHFSFHRRSDRQQDCNQHERQGRQFLSRVGATMSLVARIL